MAIEEIEVLGRRMIRVGYDLIDDVINELKTQIKSSTYVLVTDTNLAPLYLENFKEAFKRHQIDVSIKHYRVNMS